MPKCISKLRYFIQYIFFYTLFLDFDWSFGTIRSAGQKEKRKNLRKNARKLVPVIIVILMNLFFAFEQSYVFFQLQKTLNKVDFYTFF